MSEKRIVKRMATCNSCEHFKEARHGNWVGYTPVCTQLPTQTGINKYKEGSEKTVTWLFNCTEALFCPNYEKADDDYVSRVQKGMKLCHPDTADKPYNQIYKDEQFYKTEYGKELLVNLGVKKPCKTKICKEKNKMKPDFSRKDVIKIISLMQAIADGKTLQIPNGNGGWVDIKETVTLNDLLLYFDTYRIKPEPKYNLELTADELKVVESSLNVFMLAKTNETAQKLCRNILDNIEGIADNCPDVLCENCTKEDCTVRKLGLVPTKEIEK